MDEAEGGAGAGGYGDGGDPVDQFHRNEAISAIVDEGFLGEEDDDYEDLYNDVNVGEGFLQSLRKKEELGFRNEEENRTKPQDPPAPSVQVATQTGSPPARIPRANGGEGERKYERDVGTGVAGSENGSRVSGVRLDGYQSQGLRGDDMGVKGPAQPVSGGSGVSMVTGGVVGGGYSGGLRVELGLLSSKVADVPEEAVNNSMSVQGMQQQQQQQTPHAIGGGNVRNEGMLRQSGGAGNMNRPNGNMVGVGGGGHVVAGGGSGGGGGGGGSGTILFVGDLHWWTTDAELEAELVKYGPVKEVKFFDEKASGKSKGYCQVEFYDLAAASACKERMNGHMFNGRPCVVAFASPFTVKRMGEAQVNRNQQMSQQPVAQARRGPNDAVNKPVGSNISTGGNYQGGDNNRGYGRGNWGRGNAQGMGNRGPVGPARNRPGGMGGRGITGDGGNGFGQAMGTPPLMHPQAMMGQGFDPAFGGPLGRMGTYGGYLGAPAPPFSGILSSFPPVGGVGLPGVAPHVNPAFFGRCMPMNGMGMVPNSGVDGPTMGMWSDPNMGGWVGDEHGGRAAESSYGEEAVTDHQYGGEASHKRGAWSNSMKEKDRGERDWSGSSDKRYREDRDPGYDREMPREKDMIHDHDWPDRRHRHDRDIGRDRDRDHERSRDRDHERERDRDRDRERERERDRHRDDRDRYADQHKYRYREPRNDGEWERDTRRGLTPNPGSLRRKSSVQD